MTILALETSCDETAVAIVENGMMCHINNVASQIPLHRRFGGVVPEVAARAHVEQIIPLLEDALHQVYGAGDYRQLIDQKIDALAVTVGPGLVGSLLVGVSTAKALALTLNKPLIPVNHVLGHVYSNFIAKSEIRNPNIETNFNNINSKRLKHSNLDIVSNFEIRASNLPIYPFPFLTLVASGGHTELILSTSHSEHTIISQTRDDAAGEAFDKAAALLKNPPYPGGPSISQAAVDGNAAAFALPRAMARDKSGDFSFSGLKTALAQLIHTLKSDGRDILQLTPDLAASFQEAVVDTLIQKSLMIAEKHRVTHLYLAGGVAANKRLRQKLANAAEQQGLIFSSPDFQFCTDNAAMVAAAAYASVLIRDNFPWYDVEVQRHPALVVQ